MCCNVSNLYHFLKSLSMSIDIARSIFIGLMNSLYRFLSPPPFPSKTQNFQAQTIRQVQKSKKSKFRFSTISTRVYEKIKIYRTNRYAESTELTDCVVLSVTIRLDNNHRQLLALGYSHVTNTRHTERGSVKCAKQ